VCSSDLVRDAFQKREVIRAAEKATESAYNPLNHPSDIIADHVAALERIENRTYGICIATHEPIDNVRLRAKPWAKYCIEYARLRGAQMQLGHCHETEAGIPYLPFVDALRQLVVDRPDDTLRDELGSAGPDVAKLVSEVTHRLPEVVPAPKGDPRAERIRVTGRIYRTEEIPVLRRRVGAGQMIEDTDIEWRMVRSNRVKSGALVDTAGLVGMVARRSIRQGDPIRAKDLTEPMLVTKGHSVVMTFRQPGLLLTVLGHAIESGAEGQAIRIRNLQSNAIVQAIVTGPDAVTVSSAMQIGMN